jgi:hypothetical protein
VGIWTYNSGRAASRPWVWSWLIACAILVVTLPRLSLAQDGGTGGGGGLSGGEVQIQLDKFGVGNIARRGDWAAIRLKIQDSSAKQRELMVWVNAIDPDGDTPRQERVVTSNPGVWQYVWVYVRLPFNFESNSGMSVEVHEAEEVSGGVIPDDAPTGYKPKRLVGYMQLTPMLGSVAKSTDGMIGMMGNRELGLQMYMGGQNSTGEPWHPLGHEKSDILLGITPGDLPDRWMGLRQLDVLVWGTGDPAELRGDRAVAVRDWVKRGGHLVVILPGVGQTWTNANSNDLIDIMPAVSVSRKEVADLSPYRDLIMRKPQSTDEVERPFPKSGVVHTFKALTDAQPSEAVRIINNPEGECIVARRLVGAGAVTMIGLDLNQTAFSQFHIVDADVFWHRILGRRGSLEDPKPSQSQRRNFIGMMNSRRAWLYDQDIPNQIAKTNQAASGVLVGFVVFVLYWLVAGPVGFGLLKFRKWTQHAWLAFVLAAGVFTAFAWTGATMLRPAAVDAKHLTFLDHVYGQPIQRARMWANVMIPWYGNARIGIKPSDEDSSGKRPVNAITSWDSLASDGSSSGAFPDVRGYEVDTRSPDTIRVPSRSTVKQIEADWAGGPVWEMPRPATAIEGGTGKLVLNDPFNTPNGPDGRPVSMIDGTLVHNLPGTLHEVLIIVVRHQTTIAGGADRNPICSAYTFKLSDWAAKMPLDLSAATRPANGGRSFDSLQTYLGRFKPTGSSESYQQGFNQTAEANNYLQRLTALAFFTQLEPPEFGDMSSQYAAQRSATHGWDLGMWFTQPCVIIVGHLGTNKDERIASPVPLTVDGKPVNSAGHTVVRWVYPLPDNPPEYRKVDETQKQPAPPAAPDPNQEPGAP